MGGYEILTGNDAVTRGAIAAGLTFFAGYPITPATEIAERCSELLPKCGGTYMQMEDELASAAAVIGASFAGGKAMTATSGPGFSLMQENIGYAMIAEVPCVIVDVMRQGPCQGVATVPAQGDLMQARWGTHGDYPVIALAPASVSECFYETVRAFNLSERFRTPVFLLSDATLAHMSEKVRIPDESELEITHRKKPEGEPGDYMPYNLKDEELAPMAAFGDGCRWYVSGIVHDETGFPVTASPDAVDRQVHHLEEKISAGTGELERYEEYRCEGADYIVLSVGLVSRCARAAVDTLRNEGVKIGLFRPVTLWPFPGEALRRVCRGAAGLLAAEMNDGQLYYTARAFLDGECPVYAVGQNNGAVMTAETIAEKIREAL